MFKFFNKKLIAELEKEGSTLEDFNTHWSKKAHLCGYNEYIDRIVSKFINKGKCISVDSFYIIFSYKEYTIHIWVSNKFYSYASTITIYKNKKQIFNSSTSKKDYRPSYHTMCKLYEIETHQLLLESTARDKKNVKIFNSLLGED
jgi:hypothetical protein